MLGDSGELVGAGVYPLSHRAVQVFGWLVFLCRGIFCPVTALHAVCAIACGRVSGFPYHDHRVDGRQSWVAEVGCRGGNCSHSGLVCCRARHFHSFHKSLNGCITPSCTCGSKVSSGPRGPCPLPGASLCPPDSPPPQLPDLRAALREVG